MPNAAQARAAEPTARKRRQKADQFPVHCVETGGHDDLAGLDGILTVDYRDGKPYTATFDPFDEALDNVVMPVYGWLASDSSVAIVADAGKWRFTRIDLEG